MVINDAINLGINFGISKHETELILASCIGKDRQFCLINKEYNLSETEFEKYSEFIQKRKSGEPLQYILGYQEIYGNRFKVNENVLIPRYDTEICIEKAIEILEEKIDIENGNKVVKINILDMCTGSGCIAISIAKHFIHDKYKDIDINIYGVDISRDALNIARENAILNCTHNISFVESDLFSNIDKNIKFDLIISNPPYIPTLDIDKLSIEVKKEPMIALDGGFDGLDIYKKIIKDSKNYLNDNSYIVLEIGYDQANDLRKIFEEYTEYTDFKLYKDYGNNDRVVICRFQKR